MLRAKNQALLQMTDIPSAVNVMQYYTTVQPSVRSRNVYMQFSSHCPLEQSLSFWISRMRLPSEQSRPGNPGNNIVSSLFGEGGNIYNMQAGGPRPGGFQQSGGHPPVGMNSYQKIESDKLFNLWEHRSYQDSSQQARPRSYPDGGFYPGGFRSCGALAPIL